MSGTLEYSERSGSNCRVVTFIPDKDRPDRIVKDLIVLGIAAGALFGVVVLCLAVYCCCCRKAVTAEPAVDRARLLPNAVP